MALEARQLKRERYQAIGWRSTVPRVTRQPSGSYSARSWVRSGLGLANPNPYPNPNPNPNPKPKPNPHPNPNLGDVREEGGGQPPLGVQLDDDPPRGDALVRVRAHGAARLGAREQRPQGRAARKRVLRGGGVRRGRRAACCACACGRAEGREAGRLRELVHDQLPARLHHRVRVDVP